MPESENSTSVLAFIQAVLHHWLTLMSGGLITVALGIFNYLSPWPVPKSVYVVIIVLFVVMACYLAWRDARNELARLTDRAVFKREFLAERLKTILHNVDEARNADRDNTMFGGFISREWLPIGHHKEIHDFLVKYYDTETVERFDKGGISVIEELLAECYQEEDANRNTKSP
jgi:hypothetical protein